jgi:Chaperone of endosialidase/Domain of unknown function (DUF5011)
VGGNQFLAEQGSGNVGIGTSNPSAQLHIFNSTDAEIRLASGANQGLFFDNFSGGGSAIDEKDNSYFIIETNNTNRMEILGNGNLGIGTTSPAATLSTQGNEYTTGGLGVGLLNTTAGTLQTTGNATIGGCVNYNGGTSGTCLSDERVKQDINPFTDSLQEIVSLDPVTYEYNGLGGTPSDGDIRTGLIAQQVQQVAPDLVSTTSAFLNASDAAPTQLLEVNYGALPFALINAIKEIASISGTFESALIAWLGNASNGITDLYATIIHASTGNFSNEICIGSTCINQQKLAAVLAAANQSGSSQTSPPSPSNGTAASSSTDSSATPPVLQVNGDNPAIIHVGDTYTDLGAQITAPTADLNLGITTYVNGTPMNPIQLDTTQAATDTIAYVVTDSQGLTSTTTRTVIIQTPSIVPTDDASSTATTTTAQ